MNILWISHLIPYPPKAGVLIRSFNLVRELGEKHELDLLAFNQPRLMADYYPTESEGINAAQSRLKEYVNEFWIEEIPAERNRSSRIMRLASSFFSKQSYTTRWLQSKKSERKLAEILSNKKYDLIHIDTISLDYLRESIPSGTPVVLDHHNIESHMMRRRTSKEKNLLKKIYLSRESSKLYRYECSHIRDYDANIVCSKDDADRLLELSPESLVKVIPNGIKIDGSTPKRTPVPGRLLFIGGLGWYPNSAAIMDFIQNIAPLIRERDISFRLDIIGSNPPGQLIETASEFDDIFFHGFVESIAEFYQNATAFVCPISDGGGTKLKVLDAMANRVPLIGYPLACEGIEITNGENVLIAKSPLNFCEHLADIIADPTRAQRIGDNGRKLVERMYSYEKIGLALNKFYETVARQRVR